MLSLFVMIILLGSQGHDSNCVINFGASFHITSHGNFFTSYTRGDSGHVPMGNDGVSKIVGMRDI